MTRKEVLEKVKSWRADDKRMGGSLAKDKLLLFDKLTEACDTIEQLVELLEHEYTTKLHSPTHCHKCEMIDKFLGE